VDCRPGESAKMMPREEFTGIMRMYGFSNRFISMEIHVGRKD
jgi:hypothetical protein